MGFELIKPGINIDFMRFRKVAYCFSIALVLAGVISLVVKGGPRFGVDFAGGMTIQVKFASAVPPEKVKASLDTAGLANLVVQRLGQEKDNTFLIRASEHGEALDTMRATVNEALLKGFGEKKYDVQRVEMVGPKVGADLRAGALNALYYAVLLIAIYISGRFEQRWLAAGAMAAGLWACSWTLTKFGVPTSVLILAALAVTLFLCWALRLKFALGAVLADIHDIMITVGIFSLFNIEFDLTIVAALLTILGYSLNDTIIVYDRIRENFHHGDGKPMAQVVNEAVNQTLSRTLLVSGTSLLAVVCLFFFGGSVMRDFSLAMIIGIVTGTYSSIFVASPILVDLGTGLDALNRGQSNAAEGSAA